MTCIQVQWHLLFLRPSRPFASFAFPITGSSFPVVEKHFDSIG